MFEREKPLFYSDYEGLTTVVKTSTVFSDNMSELISSSVAEEEAETKSLLEHVGDHQALIAFKALRQLKIHGRIETLLGSYSKEFVQSFFETARRYLKFGSYAMALEAAIVGTSYGEDLFGVFDGTVVEGSTLMGNIYEKRGDFLNAVKYYKRALSFVQRLYKQNPLTGILNSKIYFCDSALQKTSLTNNPPLLNETPADPKEYLLQSFVSFNDVFGSDAAAIVIPLLGFEHGDLKFTRTAQEMIVMAPDSPQNFVKASALLWPKGIIDESPNNCHLQKKEEEEEEDNTNNVHQENNTLNKKEEEEEEEKVKEEGDDEEDNDEDNNDSDPYKTCFNGLQI